MTGPMMFQLAADIDLETMIETMTTPEAVNLLRAFANGSEPPPAWLKETYRDLRRRFIDRRPPLSQGQLDAYFARRAGGRRAFTAGTLAA